MKNIAKKAIPLACVLGAPFFVNANEQSEANAMLCASNYSSNKTATANGNMPSSSSSNGSKSNSMMNSQITPPAGPLVSNGADVYLTADFIWWKAQQDGLAFAVDGVSNPGTAVSEKGHLHQPHFKYEPGFKVALGVLSGHDNWDFMAEYTWLHVPKHGTKKTVDADDETPRGVQTFLQAGTVHVPEYSDDVTGSWDMHFNVLDLDMGRNFWLSKRLAVRPHVGLKFSWIQQDFDVEGHSATMNGSPFAENELDFDLKQFGVGLRAGVNTSFYLWNKWSIFGDLAMTAMWNDFESSRRDSSRELPTSDEVTYNHIHYHPFTVTGVLEVALGLRFETIFSKGRYMYLLQAGWENQVWFNQGQFVNLATPNNPGNLSLEGLTIRTGFWF